MALQERMKSHLGHTACVKGMCVSNLSLIRYSLPCQDTTKESGITNNMYKHFQSIHIIKTE